MNKSLFRINQKISFLLFFLFFVLLQHATIYGQTKEPTQLLERLENAKGNDRTKLLFKILEYYNDYEPGKSLSYAKEILRSTVKGDTTIRFKAYVKAFYYSSYTKDLYLFIRLEKKFKEEYQTFPKKYINELYTLAILHNRVFNDNKSSLNNLIEGEKLARIHLKKETGKFLIAKALIFQSLKRNEEMEKAINMYKLLPNNLKNPGSEHTLLLIDLKNAIKLGKIDFVSKNFNNYASYYTSKYFTSTSKNNMEEIPHLLDLCDLSILIKNIDSAKFYLNKAKVLLNKNETPFLKKYFFSSSINYYNALNKLELIKLYQDSIEIVNNEIIEFDRRQIENYHNQEIAFINKIKKEKVLKNKEESRKQLWMFLAVLIICIGLVVILIIYRRFISKKELALELKLINEHMKQSIAEKNQVLTEKSLRLANQNDVLREVRTKLKSVKSKMNGSTPKELNDILGIVSTRASEQQWEEFQLYFYELYSDFYKNLIELHPDLTPNERRLCAFLKLNMSSKTISMITGQSLNSVEVARGRLRGKFNLKNSSTNFVEYFDRLEKGV